MRRINPLHGRSPQRHVIIVNTAVNDSNISRIQFKQPFVRMFDIPHLGPGFGLTLGISISLLILLPLHPRIMVLDIGRESAQILFGLASTINAEIQKEFAYSNHHRILPPPIRIRIVEEKDHGRDNRKNIEKPVQNPVFLREKVNVILASRPEDILSHCRRNDFVSNLALVAHEPAGRH